MHRCFRVPTPARGFEHAIRAIRQAGEISLADRLRWNVRVDIDRYIKFDCGSEQRIVARMIEEAAFGCAVDHAADEAEFFDRALELDTRRIGSLHWQAGKAGEPIRVARHRDAVGAGKEVRTRAAV